MRYLIAFELFSAIADSTRDTVFVKRPKHARQN